MKQFPEGFFWGEKARGAFARPCVIVSERSEENILKVYSSCKEQQH